MSSPKSSRRSKANGQLGGRRRRTVCRILNGDIGLMTQYRGDARMRLRMRRLLDRYRDELLESLRRHLEAGMKNEAA